MYITALLAYGINVITNEINSTFCQCSYCDIYDITKNGIKLYQNKQKYVLIETMLRLSEIT